MKLKIKNIPKKMLKFLFHLLAVIISLKLFFLVFVPFHELVHAIVCLEFGGEIKEIDFESHVVCHLKSQDINLRNIFFKINILWEVVTFLIIIIFGVVIASYFSDKIYKTNS